MTLDAYDVGVIRMVLFAVIGGEFFALAFVALPLNNEYIISASMVIWVVCWAESMYQAYMLQTIAVSQQEANRDER